MRDNIKAQGFSEPETLSLLNDNNAVQAELFLSRISATEEETAALSQELTEPLTAILINAEAGLHWLSHAEPAVDEVRDIIKRIVADARRAADIISRADATSQP